MYKVPEQFRLQLKEGHAYHSNKGDLSGVFLVKLPTKVKGVVLFIIATDGQDISEWEHVSVSVKKYNPKKVGFHDLGRTPTWKEMCVVKGLFWEPTDCVVQFHPAEEEYASLHDTTLHLWRNKEQEFVTPPSELVGVVTGERN